MAISKSLFLLLPLSLGVVAQGPGLGGGKPKGHYQPEFPDNCIRFVPASKNDTCYSLAKENNITLDDFVEINEQLHNNCQTSLWAGYTYCAATGTATSDVNPAAKTATVTETETATAFATAMYTFNSK